MNIADQRKLGVKLALDSGAAKTLEAIKNPACCYADIFKAAASEVGIDKLVSDILGNDPWWAYQMLRCFPNVGAHRDALLKKAAENPASALHTYRFIGDLGAQEGLIKESAGTMVAPVAAIAVYEFDEEGIYEAYFGMKWIHGGKLYPSSAKWDSSWGVSEVGKGQVGKFYWKDYAQRLNLPISEGDEMWPLVHAIAGETVESAVHFTCGSIGDENVRWAKFQTTGTTGSVHLNYEGTYIPGS